MIEIFQKKIPIVGKYVQYVKRKMNLYIANCLSTMKRNIYAAKIIAGTNKGF
jgi:hypothetical protein